MRDKIDDVLFEITYYGRKPYRFVRYKYLNIKNFFVWGWRLRNNMPWDYHYLLDSMAYHFKDMAEYAEKWDRHTTTKQSVKEYRICAELCRRISECNYTNPHQAQYDAIDRWNLDKLPRNNDGSVTIPQSKVADRKITLRYLKHDEYLRKQDKDMLFNLIKRKLFNWWD